MAAACGIPCRSCHHRHRCRHARQHPRETKAIVLISSPSWRRHPPSLPPCQAHATSTPPPPPPPARSPTNARSRVVLPGLRVPVQAAPSVGAATQVLPMMATALNNGRWSCSTRTPNEDGSQFCQFCTTTFPFSTPAPTAAPILIATKPNPSQVAKF